MTINDKILILQTFLLGGTLIAAIIFGIIQSDINKRLSDIEESRYNSLVYLQKIQLKDTIRKINNLYNFGQENYNYSMFSDVKFQIGEDGEPGGGDERFPEPAPGGQLPQRHFTERLHRQRLQSGAGIGALMLIPLSFA